VTPEQYWGAIERIPLYRDRETSDGDAYLCRDRNNQPVRVTKPERLSEAERDAVVEFYRALYGMAHH
jgi:hypothetical protein